MADINEIDFRGYLFRASDFLKGANVHENQLDPSFEDSLKEQGVVPVSAQIFIPIGSPVHVDWTCTGWFSIFEIAFRVGFTLPCLGLMQDVIKSLGVMPFQIMPAVWKLVFAIESLCQKHQLVITLQDLMNCYHVRTVGKGRISFRAIKADEALITNLDSGDDKNWSSRFLFINIASLGEGFEFISDCPVAKPTEWTASIDDESLTRLRAFRSLGVKERTWPGALCRPLAPQFDPVKFQVMVSEGVGIKPVLSSFEKVDSGKVESGEKDVKPVTMRTRGKGKLAYVNEELQALRKKLKVEGMGSKDAPIEILTADQDEVMVDLPVSTPALTVDLPDIVRIKQAMKALSIRRAERDFCEAFSDRSNEISESMAGFDEENVLDMEGDLLERKSIFASFQALHFSTAAARARRNIKSEEANLKAELQKSSEALGHEMAVHAETLLELCRSRDELQVAKDALKALDAKMLQMLDDHEKELKEAAVQYSLITRIGMMQEPVESRDAWDVAGEIQVFKMKFPDSSLEEWGVSDVVDTIPTTI